MSHNTLELLSTSRSRFIVDLKEALTGATFQMSFDWGVTWKTMTATNLLAPEILVAGPDATNNPVGTTVLQLGIYRPIIRIITGSEDLHDYAGVIIVEEPLGIPAAPVA